MSALRKVLVVDDDPVVGKSFHRVLSKDKGYVVVTADNAAQALEKLREQEYDLVFTDIKMPGMDGVELAEQVRARRPWTPVVIVTGYGSAENQQRAKAAGVSGFLNKPLSPEMIEESASHALLEPVSIIAEVQSGCAPAQKSAELAQQESYLKNVALLLAAPFIGLLYAVMLPVVGLAMLGWIGAKALLKTRAARKAPTYLKNVALFISAPFVGLVYALMLPFVGMAMLTWMGARAIIAKAGAR
jgi:CheY-like chemotaxis protein